jgi:hypothetical protein
LIPSELFGTPFPFKIVFTAAVADLPAASAKGADEIAEITMVTSAIARVAIIIVITCFSPASQRVN